MEPVPIPTQTYKLSSLGLSEKIGSKSEFLGTGAINQRTTYRFMYLDGGCYRMGEVYAQNASIVYTSEEPCVVVTASYGYDDEWNVRSLNQMELSPYLALYKFVFYIPSGSIVQNYKVDVAN